MNNRLRIAVVALQRFAKLQALKNRPGRL